MSDKQDNEIIFATNPIHNKAQANEEQYFTTLKEKIGVKHPRFLEKYESNKRHAISLHAMRAYTATQCSNAVNEDFGQGIIGHEKYLGQYIRNQDKMPDLIGSKFLTGKTSKILAVTFVPQGIQENLKEIEIFEGITVKSNNDFIQKIIEKRLEIKNHIIPFDAKISKIIQNHLKIAANSASYGIFIQQDIEHTKEDNDVWFYGISSKRYVLYGFENDEIKIYKYSAHGLGHLEGIDQEQWWKYCITYNSQR